jgi:hypothetical protein
MPEVEMKFRLPEENVLYTHCNMGQLYFLALGDFKAKLIKIKNLETTAPYSIAMLNKILDAFEKTLDHYDIKL